MPLKADARLKFYGEGMDKAHAFGRGTVMLLEGIERTGSLNKATKEMGMAYSKAWRIMKDGELVLGHALIERDGAHGSTLTPYGKEVLAFYHELDAEIKELIASRMGDFPQ